MTVTTFLVSLSLGILSFKWKPNESPPADLFIFLAGVVWIVALCLFLVFTHHTYREMARARRLRNRLETGDDNDKTKGEIHPRGDWASRILIILSAAFGLLLLYLANIQQCAGIICLRPMILLVVVLVLLFAVWGGAYTFYQRIPDSGTAKTKETPPGAFGPAKRYIREGSSRHQRGWQQEESHVSERGGRVAPRAPKGSIPRTPLADRLRQRVTEEGKG
jgi:hypothetical protein